MRVVNEQVIEKFSRKHSDARPWLESWLIVTRAATWRTIQDVKRAYPAVDGGVRVYSGATVTVFDVSGNKYRMITNIVYPIETVITLELMTHAEYSKHLWEKRY